MEIAPHAWEEIMQVPKVIHAWGLDSLNQDGDFGPKEFSNSAYGVKFNYVTGGPGYSGDLFLLTGDGLVTYPLVLMRELGNLGPVKLEAPALRSDKKRWL